MNRSEVFFKIKFNVFLDTLILKICFLITKVNIFRGDLPDISANRVSRILRSQGCSFLRTVGPLIIESLWAKKRVFTGVLGALDDLPVVQTNI